METTPEDLSRVVENIEAIAQERLETAGLALAEYACENVLQAYEFGLLDYSAPVMRGILGASIAARRPAANEAMLVSA